MMQGLGIDILAIDRIEKLDNRKEFMENVFTARELKTARPGTGRDATFALGFTVKEAVLKGLGCGLAQGSFWRDIECLGKTGPRTRGNVGALLAKNAVTKIHASSARTKQYALSVVLLESQEPVSGGI